MAKIGIYGGSFDPPHLGHIQGALWAKRQLGLEKLYVVPAGWVPGKSKPFGAASGAHRKAMLEIAFRDHPDVVISDFELDNREHRTWETVDYVKSLEPGQEITLIMGSDLLKGLHTWMKPEYLLQNAAIAALHRGEKGEDKALLEARKRLTDMGGRIQVLRNPIDPISSTLARRLLAFGCGESLLDASVLTYIQRHGLYHTCADWKKLPMEELETVVIGLLNPNRVRHVLGCRDTAVELAKRWGADEENAARAGLLHDITKALDGPLQLTLCEAYGKILSDFSRKYPKTLHALTGSLVAERIFGENEAVVSAICHHTTGRADMSTLEKIIYVADYMEPNRFFAGVEKLRQLAYTDLDAALKLGLEMTLEHLKNQGAEVSPESRKALAWLNQLC